MARKILLADDSVTAQNMGRKILADAGYEVITVNNGSAALKKIAEVRPDLVILDVYMPGYSGLEVCQRLKEAPDSSRIPVMLTVGKLEPFKPDEAQRVRADAFIVKPFEASELLSALTKLEDKVVPRSEPSKPGRFARAIASVEESSRSRVQPPDGDDNGWKSRISFPHEKKESGAKEKEEEKEVEDPAIYNAMNRDLRTVVATPTERAEEKKFEPKIEEQPPQEMLVEPSVDLAAVAPLGAPQDVTPEEVAAIAAAAAQIQTLQAVLNEEQASKEEQVAPTAIVAEVAPVLAAQIEMVPVAAVSTADESSHETQDIPMTMAAAASAGVVVARWTAVSVTLSAEEAGASLEQEMHRAHAAFVAEQNAAVETSPVEIPAVVAEMLVEQPTAAIASPEPEPAPEPAAGIAIEPQIESAAAVMAVAVVEELPAIAPAEESAVASFASAEPVALPEPVSAVPQPEIEAAIPAVEEQVTAEAQQAPAMPVEPVPVVAETAPEPVALVVPEMTSVVEPAPVAEAEAVSHAFTSFVPSAESGEQQSPEKHTKEPDVAEAPSHEEEEVVKSTAAAWASWRQIRDANEPKPEAPQQEPAASVAVEAEAVAALAVAAGAEQIAQEVPQKAAENPADVASIVDSVLADLRPRLMAEISRKMSEKK